MWFVYDDALQISAVHFEPHEDVDEVLQWLARRYEECIYFEADLMPIEIKCDRHCRTDVPENFDPDVKHYLDCPVWTKLLERNGA